MNWLLATLLFWVLAVLTHGLGRRLWPQMNSLVSFGVTSFATAFALLIVLVRGAQITQSQTIAAVVLFGFLCELYVFAFTFVISSVSVWILVSKLRPKTTTAVSAPAESSAAMVAQRIERMRQTELIGSTTGLLVLTPKGRTLLRVYRRCRVFFGHGDSKS